jgi:hypothetical protein
MRNLILVVTQALIPILAIGLLAGCASRGGISEVEYAGAPAQLSSTNRALMCADSIGVQCMACDPRTHQCQFPVLNLQVSRSESKRSNPSPGNGG